MEPRDWLLITIGDQMEPIQIQKTLFKFAMETDVPKEQCYSFKPYDWGPCSFDIYDDIGILRALGFVEAFHSGRGWSLYHLTDEGKSKTEDLRQEAVPELLSALEQIRDWVQSRSFARLLNDVYKDYPQYATESLFMK